MPHELRMRLNSMLTLARSLLENDDGDLDDEPIKLVRIIHDAANNLLHLINDNLDLPSAEAGKMELVVAELAIEDLGKRLPRRFAQVAADQQLAFSVPIEPGLPASLATDSDKLEQAEDDRGLLPASQVTILVIEDDPAFARILLDMIHRQGYRALAATDGASGLQLAREHRPTGILLDVRLPVVDGWTVLDRLKVDEATRSIPVHFVSVNDSSRDSVEREAIAVLPRPVSREAIAAVLDRLLSFDEGKQRRLLVVDGDSDSRKQVRVALKAGHISIDEAENVDDALSMIAASSYDCIVLALGLPGRSGLVLMHQLASAPYSMPPVALYSARDLSPKEKHELRRYAEAIVPKVPRSTEHLLQEAGMFLRDIRKPMATDASRASIGSLAGHRVLLVDDDMRNLFTLSNELRGWGMHVSMAQDGYKALSTLESEEAPEVVVMDIVMPGMDGYSTIRAIREKPRFASLPIIVVTGNATVGDREACLENGANDYLSKPIDIDKLASTIHAWLAPQA